MLSVPPRDAPCWNSVPAERRRGRRYLGRESRVHRGCHGTACTISDQLYGVHAGGTMAHAWVQMFDSEYEAFKAYVKMFPNNATLLVDTYNTLKSGVPNAIRASTKS